MFSNRKPDTLIARLQEVLKDEKMLAQIRKNEHSRLFDHMPPAFDQVIFSDLHQEASKLASILRKISPKDVQMTDKGLILVKEADKAAIKLWAKRIMAYACKELLTEKNDIRPELLTLLAKKQQSLIEDGPETISSQTLIRAYFSFAFQYISIKLNELDDAKIININVSHASTLLMNDAKIWVREVLKERLQTVKPSYLDPASPISTEAVNDDLILGVAGALFGLFALGGAAAAYALCKKKQDNQNSPRNSSDEDHSRSSSPDDFYYI